MRKFLISGLILVIALSLAIKPDSVNSEMSLSNISTSNFDISLEFPASEMPGNSATISFNAKAKNYVRIKEMIFKVFIYDKSGSLRLLFSETVAEDARLSNDDTIQREFSLRIPENAERGALIGEISEITSSRSYTGYYSYMNYYYYYGYDYSYAYPNPYAAYYSYPYYSEPYYYEPYSYSSKESVDYSITSLTYVLASVPEYENLKTDYDSLNLNYEELSSEHSELSDDYEGAKAEILDLQNTQLDTWQELDSTRSLMYTFGASTVVLAVLAGFLGLIYLRKNDVKKRK